MSSSSKIVYCLRIELLQIEPLIWRRVWIPAGTVLQRLHKIIQAAMGWGDHHLHEFEIAGKRYEVPSDQDFGRKFTDERGQRLDRALGPSIREFRYVYDFGDNWEHRLIVEDLATARPRWLYPACVAGERACPPEDVGSVPGYQQFVKDLADQSGTSDENDPDYVRWIGGVYDSEGFDVNAANQR